MFFKFWVSKQNFKKYLNDCENCVLLYQVRLNTAVKKVLYHKCLLAKRPVV